MGALLGGVLGFFSGGGVAFPAVAAAFSSADNVDVAQVGGLLAIPAGLLGGGIGAFIGMIVGAHAGNEEEENSPYPSHHACPGCGCKVPDVYRTCRHCGVRQEQQ
ncbi:MAG: hypothetical protein QUS33_03315 [Dehalococcoidia bacterium]|nr:hypothetical protein [Dehalococcoidia bacterium]